VNSSSERYLADMSTEKRTEGNEGWSRRNEGNEGWSRRNEGNEERPRRNTLIICFKCYQRGHFSTDCTNEKCVPVPVGRLKLLEDALKELEGLKKKEKEVHERAEREMRKKRKGEAKES